MIEGAKRSMPEYEQIERELTPKKGNYFVESIGDHSELYFHENVPILFRTKEGTVLPHLQTVIEYPEILPYVYVDDGAVKPLLSGAKLKAPGIKGRNKDFEKGTALAVRLLNEESAFAIGVAMMSSDEAETAGSGDAVNILHVLKDGLWDVRKGV